MKTFERIFLYSALAILFFYVFLVDGNVESQELSLGQYITARRIDIVDDEGRPVIMLRANENGGMINIANKKGDPTFLVTMGVDENGSGGIQINDEDGNLVALMMGTKRGGAMRVSNKDGCGAFMAADEEDGGSIVIHDEDGNPVALMTSNKRGTMMIFGSKDGNPLVMIGATPKTNDGYIYIYNKYEQAVVAMETAEADDGQITVTNKYGKVIGSLP